VSPGAVNTVLSPEQLAFYRQHEYLILRGVVPDSLLNGAQAAIERWVESIIQAWIREGRLSQDYRECSFDTRLMKAWNAAGRPAYNPNPTQEIVSPELYAVLRFPLFIQVAQAIFDSPNITANGIFHCRPDLPDQAFTDTPWHQDAQCCPSLAGTQFMVMWFPLMDVDENNGCLQAAVGRQHQGRVYPNYKDPSGYYISMRPDDAAQLVQLETLRMKRGDLLFFNETLPHRAIPNHSHRIRWSVDIRYNESNSPIVAAANRSFICAHEDPARIERSYERWVQRMAEPIEMPK
jgi:phytanoyl-CoA hydroxylase